MAYEIHFEEMRKYARNSDLVLDIFADHYSDITWT